MNVWELVTSSSTLAIQAGNTFWDHLNSLGAGGGIMIASSLSMDLDDEELTIDLDDEDLIMDIDEDLTMDFCDEE